MPTWPITLPQLPFDGVTTRDDDAVLRTPMDTGPPTRRNRFTAHTQKLSYPMVLTGAEKVDFDFFYRNDLKNGSLAFDWIDLADDTTVSMAFTGPVQWALRAGAKDAADRVWTGVLNLEVQP